MTTGDLEQKLTHNPSSPLFARLAGEYLAEGRVEDAKKLCLTGLDSFPSYVTAQLLLARCYREEHNEVKSLEHLDKARSLHPGSPYLETLFNEWSIRHSDAQMEQPSQLVAEEISEVEPPAVSDPLLAETSLEAPFAEHSPEPEPEEHLQPETHDLGPQDLAILERFDAAPPPDSEDATASGMTADLANEMTQQDIPEPVTERPEPEMRFEEPPVPSAIDDLDIIESREAEEPPEPAPPPLVAPETGNATSGAEENTPAVSQEELSAPPPPASAPAEPPSRPYDDEGRIVSKTLAEIYVSQGAYSEAILTYQLLKTLRPAQSEDYDKRIKELEPKIHDKPAS